MSTRRRRHRRPAEAIPRRRRPPPRHRANVEATWANGKPPSEEAIAAAGRGTPKSRRWSGQIRGRILPPRVSQAVAPCTTFTWSGEPRPLLYSYVRFLPARVLRWRGYTSMFILQALRDNAAELDAYRSCEARALQMRRRPVERG